MDILFEVDGKDYHAHLFYGYMKVNSRDHRYSHCVITTNNPIEIYSGIAMKHPNDGMPCDEKYGYRLAFKRAVFQMFITRQLKEGGPIKVAGLANFLEKFRVPFGKALHEYVDELPY